MTVCGYEQAVKDAVERFDSPTGRLSQSEPEIQQLPRAESVNLNPTGWIEAIKSVRELSVRQGDKMLGLKDAKNFIDRVLQIGEQRERARTSEYITRLEGDVRRLERVSESLQDQIGAQDTELHRQLEEAQRQVALLEKSLADQTRVIEVKQNTIESLRREAVAAEAQVDVLSEIIRNAIHN